MLRFIAKRRKANDREVVDSIAGIERRSGIYFGCDHGVAGLHPLSATIVAEPSLLLRVSARGVTAEAVDAFGAALLEAAELATFRASLGERGTPIATLRAFHAAFEPTPDVRLVGALPFELHLRASDSQQAATDVEPDGFLLFGRTFLERDAAGVWHRVELEAVDPTPAQSAASASESESATTGTGAAPAPALPHIGDEPSTHDDFPAGGYAAVVARAVERLASTPLVSLTLSQSFRKRLTSGVSPVRAFERLRAANPAPATFFFRTPKGECVFGASPDLQLALDGAGSVEAFPVCGTVARGHGPVGEAEALRELFAAGVDAASLTVCSDALRADLAPCCEPGSLRLTDRSRPMSLATVVHAVDRLQGRLRAGCDAWDAIVATAAPPMLVGVPRALALDAIAALEASPRRWYGGLVVEVRGDGTARVGTLLRAASLRGGVAEVRTGGDLLADSDPAREEMESRVKAVSLWRALEIEAGSVSRRAAAAGESMPSAADGSPRIVSVFAGGDAFAASLVDALTMFGVQVTTGGGDDAGDAVRVVSGQDAKAEHALHGTRCIAIGDAAFALLRARDVTLTAIRPENGRLALAVAEPVLAAVVPRPFHVGRYARYRLGRDPASSAGWQVWLRDAHDRTPLALVHPSTKTVCLLFRPESTLTDPIGLAVLRHAMSFAEACDDGSRSARVA